MSIVIKTRSDISTLRKDRRTALILAIMCMLFSGYLLIALRAGWDYWAALGSLGWAFCAGWNLKAWERANNALSLAWIAYTHNEEQK